MKCSNHLYLETHDLAPSAELTFECPGWCLFRLNQGCGYWLNEDGARDIASGQVVALSPLREGVLRASQLGPVTLSCFRFSPELAVGLLTPAERDAFEGLAARPEYAARLFPQGAAGVRMMVELVPPASARTALLERAELLRVVATLFADELSRPDRVGTSFLSARQRLRLLVHQMPELELLAMTPEEMALRCGSSVAYCKRSFRDLFGMSLRRKQETMRLQRARQALVESPCCLETLAREAGFSDAKEFGAAFKKQFGVTPQQWRHPRLRKTRAGSAGGKPSAT